MSAKDREVVMMADGAWTRGSSYATGIEPLRLLRWILRIDSRLPTVGQQLWGDFGIAHEIVVEPRCLRRGRERIESDSVRVSRDDAQTTLMRCVAEAISRGYQPAQDEATAIWANVFPWNLSGNQDEDFLLGEKLVSEPSREQLEWATTLAGMRTHFLSVAMELLETGRTPEDRIASSFAEEPGSIAERS